MFKLLEKSVKIAGENLKMKKSITLAAILGVATIGRADVTWEHVGSVRMGDAKKPAATLQMTNQWSGQRHRTSLSYDATAMGAPAKEGKGFVTAIQRFDDDRLIWSSSADKKYMDEPLKGLPGRFRINFWKNLDPKLSPDEIPALTLEQRRRLGQEVRAAVSPFTKKLLKTYFRALPEQRTINGMTTRGYRLTQLVNTAGTKGGQEWMKIAAEWWLADTLPGDEEVRAFAHTVQTWKKEAGGPTVSMWINEILPIAWQATPDEFHQALQSLMGSPDSPSYGFQGTPVQLYLTVSPPPMQAMAMGGEVHFALELKKREVAPVAATLFDAPTGYQRVELEPLLKKMRDFVEKGEKKAAEMMP